MDDFEHDRAVRRFSAGMVSIPKLELEVGVNLELVFLHQVTMSSYNL